MKYPEGSNLEYDQERMDLGSALRRLGHAVVGHEAEIDQLRETRMSIDALSHMLESTPIRIRDVAQFLGSKTVEFPDGSVITSHICRPGSGPGSPHGLDMVVRRSGVRATRMSPRTAQERQRHLLALPEHAQDGYRLLALRSVEMALQAGRITAQQAEALRGCLRIA